MLRMEDGAKENTALNIQKPLEILVTDEDKHGTDIACMSDFFGIYIEQLSAELSNQVMRGVVEKIPAADVQILGELVHGVDVLLSGKYGYIPDFDSLPNDVKDKLKKGIYTLGESRQVEDNVRAVVLDEKCDVKEGFEYSRYLGNVQKYNKPSSNETNSCKIR